MRLVKPLALLLALALAACAMAQPSPPTPHRPDGLMIWPDLLERPRPQPDRDRSRYGAGRAAGRRPLAARRRRGRIRSC